MREIWVVITCWVGVFCNFHYRKLLQNWSLRASTLYCSFQLAKEKLCWLSSFSFFGLGYFVEVKRWNFTAASVMQADCIPGDRIAFWMGFWSQGCVISIAGVVPSVHAATSISLSVPLGAIVNNQWEIYLWGGGSTNWVLENLLFKYLVTSVFLLLTFTEFSQHLVC